MFILRHVYALVPLLMFSTACSRDIEDFSVAEFGYCEEHLDCIGDLFCVSHVCTDLTPQCLVAGDYCDATSECCMGACLVDTRVCHDPCVRGSDCVSGCCVEVEMGGAVCGPMDWCL